MVKQYFAACERAFPAQRTHLRRLSLALCRGGVETMEALYALRQAQPEKLLEIRSVGAKSLPLIEKVCRRYERMDAAERTRSGQRPGSTGPRMLAAACHGRQKKRCEGMI